MASKYRVICKFKDLQDNGFFYNVGDVYPRKSKRASKKRIAELSSSDNRRGMPLIEEIAEEETEE